MSENCDAIAIFPTYDQFGAIWKPDSGRIVYKTYVFVNSNLSSYKNWKHSSLTIALSKGTIFAKKCRFFAKNADISKIKRVYYISMCTYVPNLKFLA